MALFKNLNPEDRDLMKNLLAAFANNGHIDLNCSDSEILKQLEVVAKTQLENWVHISDHTSDLLSQARAAKKKDNFPLAVLMYATWVEHVLNMLLIRFTNNKGLDKYCNAMIKDSSLRTKSTWLLALLCGKSLSDQTANRIQKLAEARNAFIHYKWVQSSDASRSDQERALKDAEKVVKALQSYQRKEAKIVSDRSKVVKQLFSANLKKKLV